MRLSLLAILGLVGCAPTVVGSSARPVPPAASVAPTSAPTSAPPVAEVPKGPPEITPEARANARAAFAQALELWSSARVTEASSLVAVGLSVIKRRLPEHQTEQSLNGLRESAAFPPDVGLLVVADAETLSVVDARTGKFLGLRAHDAAQSLERPALSPSGSAVVAPAGAELVVYESRGLIPRLRIATRRNAPFAFIAEDKIVTARLGDPASGAFVARGQLVQRELASSESTAPANTVSTPASAEVDDELSDDEIAVVDLRNGKTLQVLRLAPPPDYGLMRKVASLPPSQRCNASDECQRFELNPTPIGRRIEELRIAAGMVVASWRGGATTFHRLRDGKLIGAFRSRGERWKPGLVAIWPKPPRAAVATSLPGVGRGNEPPFSVTALFDLTQGRVIELIDECRWATGLAFSADGTRLMVGDLRRACLHDGRTGRFLHTTEEVRPARGFQDDQQDVSVRAAPEGRWLITAADGSFGVFRGDDDKAIYRGKNDAGEGLVASDEKSLFVPDFSGGEARLITFGPSGVERRMLRREELEQKTSPPELASSPKGQQDVLLERLLQTTCLIEGFRLPSELCHPQPGEAR